MKNGLLVCAPIRTKKNIGDYIQSVAQEQFFNHIDTYVEREDLCNYHSSDVTRLIMNAWFMWYPEKFPPSADITPCFVSFHIVPSIAPKLLTAKSIAYLKKYEPIGARDKGTEMLLERNGIKSYFSGCLTLTLGLKYKSREKDGSIYFVDPYYDMCGMRMNLFSVKSYIKTLKNYLKYRKVIAKVLPHFEHEYKTVFGLLSQRLENRLCASNFYASYHTLFTDDVLHKANYIQHSVSVEKYRDHDALLAYARELINKYAKASFVITSRIHCGLPCLGVETPVLFVMSDILNGNKLRSAGRLDGLIELFHVIHWQEERFEVNDFEISSALKDGKIGLNFKFKNKDDYKNYSEELIDTITNFLKG